MKRYLTYSDAVAEALSTGKPVVAIESTVIAHGLPPEAALATAASMQVAVTKAGAVPAVIAILDGAVKIGLDDAEIERLALSENVLKVSRRDVAYALATKCDGATTVASTMMAAAAAGIPIMATGGIGGVHRGVGTSLDISADLQELGSTDVAVVCSGAKAILDLPKTLEYLETMGVPVIGMGCDEFPAFFVASSGLPVTHRLETPDAIATLIRTHRELSLSGGILIANPPPPELALAEDSAEVAIKQAVEKARAAGISGHAVTPYLLGEVAAETDGKSLSANQALLISNAGLAAQIARALEKQPSAA